ncbi:MAG: hypothetical protein IJX69_00860 [Oscillospiraceae bacterium]|nr:hypothetical protein [Oscillospiraceae bacterium]
MVNIGIDFGSTYTTISVYRKDTGMVETLNLAGDASPYIPTLAALDNGHYRFGRTARASTGKPGVALFKAFKMLLPETDTALLTTRGYSAVQTPQLMSAKFLEHYLRRTLDDFRESTIEHLVIGAPEIWSQRDNGPDGRVLLKELCKGLPFVKDVQVVSEPAAATAFFAHNFKLKTGRDYNGSILLIDYGGGTLDLTLTTVSSENGGVEIKVLERIGAGENEDGRIGQAGIVYMETVMEEAIRRCDRLGNTTPAKDGRFYRAVDDLEQALKEYKDDIKKTFDEFDTGSLLFGENIEDAEEDLEELEEKNFTYIDYKGNYIPITYALLVEVYNQLIYPVLQSKLVYMIDYMERTRIAYMDQDQDIFKIALVGGFGNFYLVKKQIEDKFRFSDFHDKRQKDIILIREDRERAISKGAAMLSAGVITIRNTAPFNLGFYSRDVDGSPHVDYAIRYKQDLEYGVPCYARDEATGKPARFLLTAGRLTQVVTSRSLQEESAKLVPVRPEYAGRLTELAQAPRPVSLGFSMDPVGVISLHVRDFPIDSAEPMEADTKIELTQYNGLLALNDGKLVIDL